MDTVGRQKLRLRGSAMLPLAAIAKLSLLLALPATHAVAVCGVDVPHAKVSPASRALDSSDWPEAFPYTAKDLTPMMAGNDGFFYFLPKFVQHAGEECRDSLTRFYEAVLPASGEGDVLDLCSSWTSHYPSGWRPSPPRRCVALGLNPLELLANPSKTEWRVQDLNKDPQLPYADAAFDLVTNSLSVDYMTRPLQTLSRDRAPRPPPTMSGGLVLVGSASLLTPPRAYDEWPVMNGT